MLLFLFACAEPEPEAHCPSWDDAAPLDGVLSNEHDCGHWTLPMGEHLYVSVYIDEPEVPCSESHDDALDRPYEPSYTNMGNDAPKWTFDFVGLEPASDQTIEIVCEEGTEWHARVDVAE